MRITLSPYTIAANCTDTTDCNDGISELWNACDRYKAAGQKVPEYIYKRIEKLNAKRDKCSLKEHGLKYDEWLISRFDKLEALHKGRATLVAKRKKSETKASSCRKTTKRGLCGTKNTKQRSVKKQVNIVRGKQNKSYKNPLSLQCGRG